MTEQHINPTQCPQDMNSVIDVAVAWWAEKVTGLHHHDTGDKSAESGFGMFLADMGMKKVTEEQTRIFKETLKALISDEAVIVFRDGFVSRYTYHGIDLYCDYGPGRLLHEAAEAAGIPALNFPFKTGMIVKPDSILVKEGYAMPYTEIYSINTRRYNDGCTRN